MTQTPFRMLIRIMHVALPIRHRYADDLQQFSRKERDVFPWPSKRRNCLRAEIRHPDEKKISNVKRFINSLSIGFNVYVHRYVNGRGKSK